MRSCLVCCLALFREQGEVARPLREGTVRRGAVELAEGEGDETIQIFIQRPGDGEGGVEYEALEVSYDITVRDLKMLMLRDNIASRSLVMLTPESQRPYRLLPREDATLRDYNVRPHTAFTLTEPHTSAGDVTKE